MFLAIFQCVDAASNLLLANHMWKLIRLVGKIGTVPNADDDLGDVSRECLEKPWNFKVMAIFLIVFAVLAILFAMGDFYCFWYTRTERGKEFIYSQEAAFIGMVSFVIADIGSLVIGSMWMSCNGPDFTSLFCIICSCLCFLWACFINWMTVNTPRDHW